MYLIINASYKVIMDFCSNSLSLNQKHKECINKQVSIYIDRVVEELEKKNLDFNLYFTGSLSRKEPAILIKNDKSYTLQSDLDFMVVVNEEDLDKLFLRRLTLDFNQKYPEQKGSFILLGKNSLDKVNSYMRRDLIVSFDAPLYQKMEVPSISKKKLENDQYIESALNSVSCYFIHPGHFNEEGSRIYRGLKYYKIKAALECIRAIFTEEGLEVKGYYDIYINRFHKCINKIVSPDLIKALVLNREIFNEERENDFSLEKLFLLTVKNHYKVYTDNELINIIYSKVDEKHDVFTSFQNSIISYVISLASDNWETKKSWLELLSRIIKEMNFMNTRFKQEYEFLGEQKWAEDTLNDLYTKKVANALYMFRYDYYKLLFYRNTGSTIIPDLEGVI
jgi:hypothetical protein